MPRSHSCAISIDTSRTGNEMPASMMRWGTAAGRLSWSVGMTVERSESFLHASEVLSGHSEPSSSSRSHQICRRASPGLSVCGTWPLICAQGGWDLLTPHGRSADARPLSTSRESQARVKIRSYPCFLTSGVKGSSQRFLPHSSFQSWRTSTVPPSIFFVLKCKTYIPIYKIDNQQGPTVQHRELYSIFCNNQ